MGVFKQKPNVSQQIREQCRRIRSEIRSVDRVIAKTLNEQKKIELEMKRVSKNNDVEVVRILAKSLVVSRRGVAKLYATKAQMNSLELQLKENLSQSKLTQSIKCSADVIRIMNSLVNVPEIHQTMAEMSNEMVKMGMIDEMLTDTVESVMQGDDDEDEEIEKQVNSILGEILLTSKSERPVPANTQNVSDEELTPVKRVSESASAKQSDEERLHQLLTK